MWIVTFSRLTLVSAGLQTHPAIRFSRRVDIKLPLDSDLQDNNTP